MRGRLLGQPLAGGKLQLNVLQTYDYQSNDAYATGSQSFEASLGSTLAFSQHTKLLVMGWGGLTVLGAIDSLPLGVTEKPPEEETGDGGQGVSEGPRFYDYGPGSNFGGVAYLTHHRRKIWRPDSYEGRQLYSLDGVRANHFLQRTRLDILVPVHGRFGIGTSADNFFREELLPGSGAHAEDLQYPQVRAYLTWSQQ